MHLTTIMIAYLMTAVVLEDTVTIPLDAAAFVTDVSPASVAGEALRHFRERVESLGARMAPDMPGEVPAVTIELEEVDQVNAGWSDFQRDQGFAIDFDGQAIPAKLTVRAATYKGLAYGISELEVRLRVADGKAVLSFPEWHASGNANRIEECPAIETRGEYLNIGYNIPGITPHEWTRQDWHEYIDLLALARLNRLYFYVWADAWSMYPGSATSKNPLSRAIHEGLKDAIEYAHRRGLQVTYMICPTLLPKDVWLAHPEIRAEIEYADAGFPATCSRAPGAWSLMQDVYRSEMEWFSKADAIQVWFYDPGGCWCERHGCRLHQAEKLARELKGFAELFHERAASPNVEYNLWPIWLWEERFGIRYRDELATRIREAFADQVGQVMAIGAIDNDTTKPVHEKELGFKTGVFVFPTNVESGYPFLIPMVRYLSATIPPAAKEGYQACFVHRLEARTRYANTFFAAQWMWNPAYSPEEILRRFADWQTADEIAGEKFAEVLKLLDTFTDEGANTKLIKKMTLTLENVLADTPQPCRTALQPYQDTVRALAPIAESISEKDAAKQSQYEAAFEKALQMSNTFRPLALQAGPLFQRYGEFLKRGWKSGIF